MKNINSIHSAKDLKNNSYRLFSKNISNFRNIVGASAISIAGLNACAGDEFENVECQRDENGVCVGLLEDNNNGEAGKLNKVGGAGGSDGVKGGNGGTGGLNGGNGGMETGGTSGDGGTGGMETGGTSGDGGTGGGSSIDCTNYDPQELTITTDGLSGYNLQRCYPLSGIIFCGSVSIPSNSWKYSSPWTISINNGYYVLQSTGGNISIERTDIFEACGINVSHQCITGISGPLEDDSNIVDAVNNTTDASSYLTSTGKYSINTKNFCPSGFVLTKIEIVN